MCQICGLLNETFPSPRSLVRTARELNINADHFVEVLDKAVDKLQTQKEKDDFTRKVLAEDFIELLRMT
jgi:CRISPR/Cas system CSM-associated protein Csm2 small subunit